jgi:hypothetical protein
LDWRNKRISNISTDPNATTNYFDAHNNSLPYELSPAFFKPEVISKYKADTEKYTVGERDISCRAAWHLEGFDVNEAGQVFAYICYLRNLPYNEQLYWRTYNERPRTGISERAVTNDFKGEFMPLEDPLMKILSILRLWEGKGVDWWVLRNEKLCEKISTPLTESKDEWGESFMNLSKLIIEGFETSKIHARLEKAAIPYEKNEKSIALLERLIKNSGFAEKVPLIGLRTVQRIRTEVKGHASGQEVEKLCREIIAEHGNYTKHFKYICEMLALELGTISAAFTKGEREGDE